eukprot:13851399-Alexandrium_andersonii.AAC.1
MAFPPERSAEPEEAWDRGKMSPRFNLGPLLRLSQGLSGATVVFTCEINCARRSSGAAAGRRPGSNWASSQGGSGAAAAVHRQSQRCPEELRGRGRTSPRLNLGLFSGLCKGASGAAAAAHRQSEMSPEEPGAAAGLRQ